MNRATSSPALESLIAVAAGREPADLVLRGGQIVNVLSGEVYPADIAILGDRIAGVGEGYSARQVIDVGGQLVCPGFIDAHVHIESSLLAVPEFARVVAARGTTAVIADPHEFANVMGAEGIRFVLRTAKHAPIGVFVMLSSCVPASPLEGAGAELSAVDLLPFLSDPWVRGVAEMMNYPGVIEAREEVLDKIRIADERTIDGHAPGLTGRALVAYAAAGIASDHESITASEAIERLRLGMHVMVREGSQTRNLEALLPVITPQAASQLMFCTDDKNVEDLLGEGHIDFMIRKAVAAGLDPVLAVRLATYSPARYFGLRRVGAIAPGYQADLAIVSDWKEFRVTRTIRHGATTALDGACTWAPAASTPTVVLRSSVNVQWLEPGQFAIPLRTPQRPHLHVIEVMENRIDTGRSFEPATVRDGQVVADPARDLAKLAVVERHRASGEIGLALVRGFGLQRGALASSVAHDAHNLIAVGMNDDDLFAAVVHLVKMRGGLCAVAEGKVLADLPLPIAGLVSDAPAATVAAQHRRIVQAAHGLGCRLAQPFMALSFLSLSVIGKLKLTNQGLVDVERFARIPLIAD